MTEELSEGAKELQRKSAEMNDKQHKAADILTEAREIAINEGIPIIPYLIAIFMEYKEIRDQAETSGEYKPEEIAELIKTFESAFDEGKIGPRALARLATAFGPITGYA